MAARYLVAAGKTVLVVEAQERVGGRTLNAQPEGGVLELGGQWLGPTQKRMYALCRELGLKTYAGYSCGEHVIRFGGELTRVNARQGAAPAFPKSVRFEVQTLIDELTTMSSQLDLEAPYTHPQAPVWDRQTFAVWLQRHTTDSLIHAYFRVEMAGLFAAETSELSLLHVLFYLKSGGGFANLVGMEGGAQQDRILGGSQRVAQKMAEALKDRVLLSSPVRGLEQTDRGVAVKTDAQVIRAGRVIVALPPAAAAQLCYDPPLPRPREQLIKQSPMGSVIKVMLVYDAPFWRNDGLSGQVFSDSGAVRMTFDNSPPEGHPGVLMGFMEGAEAQRMSRLSREEREQETTSCLALYFGSEAKNYRYYLEKNWPLDPWAGGGYGAYFRPGTWTACGQALRQPCGRIHWAGAETSSVGNGYMEGAVRSGERAAQEVLATKAPVELYPSVGFESFISLRHASLEQPRLTKHNPAQPLRSEPW